MIPESRRCGVKEIRLLCSMELGPSWTVPPDVTFGTRTLRGPLGFRDVEPIIGLTSGFDLFHRPFEFTDRSFDVAFLELDLEDCTVTRLLAEEIDDAAFRILATSVSI